MLLTILVLGFLVWVGIALIIYSESLSRGYNAWTTRLRERHPKISRPPTPEARELNTRIMTWGFRILGATLIVDPLIEFIWNRMWR
ncbi:MAG: hypothetical protein WBF35_06840 [Candidatus Acidiferrales bacterium]